MLRKYFNVMKKNTSIRDLLGITQEEASLLLRVKRSQLSLYELGLRDIPADALLKMTKVWRCTEEAGKIPVASQPGFKEQEKEWQHYLANEIKKNELEQMRVKQKLEAIEKKYQSHMIKLLTVSCWDEQNGNTTEREKKLLRILTDKAVTKTKENGWCIQEKHRLQLQALEQYGKLLKDKISVL